jgi:Tol biopolymer transport system component
MHVRTIYILITYFSYIQFTYSQDIAEHLLIFEEAKFTMETKGDLERAIGLFENIIEKYGGERAYAAKSQLYIGLCYEKLGRIEAQNNYQKVIDQYPEQEQEVAIAKERLSSIAMIVEKDSMKPTFRKIRIPSKPDNGVLSPDGKKLAFASHGSVWIVPVRGNVQRDITGEPVMITEKMEASNFGNSLSWSGDGKWIAFNVKGINKDEIFVVSATGGEPQKVPVKLYRSTGGSMHDHRLSLSPGGKLLAFSSSDLLYPENNLDKDPPSSIYVVSVEGGAPIRLTHENTEQPVFSPDGKNIAYVKKYRSDNGKSHSEGWMIPAVGGFPTRLTDETKHVEGPIWSPEGKMIAFTCRKNPDHGELSEILIIPLPENGRSSKLPIKIEFPHYTYEISAGWTADNKIGFYFTNPRYQALYTVPITGGKATQITPEGWANNPCWALDGENLFFRWDEGKIASVPSAGGEISIVPIKNDTLIYEALPGGGNHISPDGKEILFAGVKKGIKGVHIMKIPIEGGNPTPITTSPTQDRFPCWSPDGDQIAFIRYHEKSKGRVVMNIYTISSNGGDVTKVNNPSSRG